MFNTFNIERFIITFIINIFSLHDFCDEPAGFLLFLNSSVSCTGARKTLRNATLTIEALIQPHRGVFAASHEIHRYAMALVSLSAYK